MEPLPNTTSADEIVDTQLEETEEEHDHNATSDHKNGITTEEATTNHLERTLSRHTQRSATSTIAEPPDGGLNAWLKVFGCFLMYANTLAFQIAFGAYQTYYQRNFLSSSSPSSISWIGTIQSWFLIMMGVLSGPLFDLGWFRPMLLAGNALIVLGLFLLSISRSYVAVFMTQGVCMGLGIGLIYVPTVALLGLYFKRKLPLVQGIVTSGNTVGGISYVVAFDRMTESSGFGWAVRTQAFVCVGMAALAIPALLYGTSSVARSRKARKMWDATAWRDPIFLLFTASLFCGNLGYITPYFFIPSFAQDCLGSTQQMASYVLVFGIAGSFFGRLFMGFIGVFVGPLVAWGFCAVTAGLLAFCWMAVTSETGFIAWSVVWGFCSAGLATLPAAVIASISPDQRRLGSRSGMSFGIASISALLGPPIAGALIKQTDGLQPGTRLRSDYLGAQAWAGCCLLVDGAMLFVLWIMVTKREKRLQTT